MKAHFRAALTAALVAGLTMPAMAMTHSMKMMHMKITRQTTAQTQLDKDTARMQMLGQVTVNDAATGEGQGDASGAPTGLSGQIATGNLSADAARDNNPSNGTATNIGPSYMARNDR